MIKLIIENSLLINLYFRGELLMKKIIYLCFVCVYLFAFTSIAYAENEQWQADNYDFSQVQKVYVEPNIVYTENVMLSDFDALKVQKMLRENQAKVKDYTLVEDKSQADATVQIKISQWGTNKYWNYPRTDIEYKTIYRTDSEGRVYTTQIPIPVYVPGYYSYTQYFLATYTVTDKSGNKIYEYVDTREGNKNAYAMFGRATKNFFKSFAKLKQK